MAYIEREGTRTLRRQLRSSLRGIIGTSSDEAPGAERAIRAAGYLGDILNYATSGNLRLVLLDRAGNRVPFSDALATARGRI